MTAPRDPKCREKWCAMLAKLCAPMDAPAAANALVTMLPLFADLPDAAFTHHSLTHVAELAIGVPSYARLRAWMDAWWKANKPPAPALPDNVAHLSAEERHWLATWERWEAEGHRPAREADGRLSRPDIRDWRAHHISLLQQYAPHVAQHVGQDEEAAAA
jgi:hypothetical protein